MNYKKSDFSTVFSSISLFILYILGILLLYIVLQLNFYNMYSILKDTISKAVEKKYEILIINNTQSSTNNPNIVLINIGQTSIYVNYFMVYIDGKLYNYSAYINDLYRNGVLDPGESVTLTVYGTFNPGWHEITVITPSGVRIKSLINLQ